MKKLAAVFATFLLTGCVTFQMPGVVEEKHEEEEYVYYDENGEVIHAVIRRKGWIPKRLPAVMEERCDASCKSACYEIYMPDVVKYHDCVDYQNYADKEWLLDLASIHQLTNAE